jgi:hypothetical protein
MRSTPFFNATISAVAADARAERKRARHDKAWSLAELHTHIRNNQDFTPNGERLRQRERISTAESMVTKW